MHARPNYPHVSNTEAWLPSAKRVRAASRQAGASAVEFSIVVIPVLLAALGTIEVAQWLFTRQAVSLALLEAGRAASVRHAHPRHIETAFEQALQALFVSDTSRESAPDRLLRALQQRESAIGQAPWNIEILSPTAAAFADFSQPNLQVDGAAGLAVINNNYLAQQHSHYLSQGWEQGRGPRSQLTVFQSNTLVLRATWLHKPVVPGVSQLLRLLGTPQGSYSQHAMALGGYLPIKQELALVMQSHPVNWPLASNGKVTGPLSSQASGTGAHAQQPCTGIWCINPEKSAYGSDSGTPPGIPGGPESSGPGPAPGPHPSTPPAPGPYPDTGEPPTGLPDHSPHDPACGVSLCCGT